MQSLLDSAQEIGAVCVQRKTHRGDAAELCSPTSWGLSRCSRNKFPIGTFASDALNPIGFVIFGRVELVAAGFIC
jgi:hypothetical protein